jgi:DNA-directed RNA polymerase subunit RPC12/RpoP
LVEDELINGDDSWCPHCKDTRLIVTDYGRIPMPSMYGRWQMREAERTKAAPIPAVQVPEASESSSLPPPLSPVSLTRKLTFLGDTTMKHFTTHTGTYSCLNCYIQYELTAEKSLRCDDCRGPLVKGTLEELGVDPDDLDDEDE